MSRSEQQPQGRQNVNKLNVFARVALGVGLAASTPFIAVEASAQGEMSGHEHRVELMSGVDQLQWESVHSSTEGVKSRFFNGPLDQYSYDRFRSKSDLDLPEADLAKEGVVVVGEGLIVDEKVDDDISHLKANPGIIRVAGVYYDKDSNSIVIIAAEYTDEICDIDQEKKEYINKIQEPRTPGDIIIVDKPAGISNFSDLRFRIERVEVGRDDDKCFDGSIASASITEYTDGTSTHEYSVDVGIVR